MYSNNLYDIDDKADLNENEGAFDEIVYQRS